MNSPTKKLKVAVVGAGFANSPDGRENFAIRGHLPALKALADRFEVVAVCTRRQESADESARHFGIPHAFDGVERMLNDLPEIDIVCVAVRPSAHHAVTMPALRAGKHVYCEHPLGVGTAQGREMTELARTRGVHTALGHQQHFHPAALEMMRLVREGYIGRPLTFSYGIFGSNYIVPRPSHRQWIFQLESSGHPGYRTGSGLERIMAVLGRDIRAICADMAIKVPERPSVDGGSVIRSDQHDTAAYLLEMDDGITGSLHFSNAAWFASGERFELYGTEGMLMLQSVAPTEAWQLSTSDGDPNRGGLCLFGNRVEIDDYIKNPVPPERLQRQFKEILARDAPATNIPEGRAAYYVAQAWAAFHEAIVTSTPYAPGFEEALKIHDVLDAAEASAATRAWASVNKAASAA